MDEPNREQPVEPIFERQRARPQLAAAPRKSRLGGILMLFLFVFLCGSLLVNFVLLAMQIGSIGSGNVPESFHSGDAATREKLAIITVSGTIMPPFTERYLKAIKSAEEDEAVKGVLLVVDSPGGLVADSHQIYHRLKELSSKKLVYVAMQRMAASGGYYIAMGAGEKGRIFAEPSTWTGSIGVIIPRYDVSKLAEKWDVKSEPLTTGPFKDALSPFREMSEAERQVWNSILDDAFQRFVAVIADNRTSLDTESVRMLATGQVYTADQAVANGLVDKIGYLEDAITDLKAELGLRKARVVQYEFQPSVLELLTGSIESQHPERQWQFTMESTVPRAMYLCSWGLGIPGW